MKKSTLWTETKGNLRVLASQYFDAFTIAEGTGVWKGEVELSSQIIYIVHDQGWGEVGKAASLSVITNKFKALAEDIKRINSQECVMVTEENITATLL